jgi:hypothetical protein
LNLRNIERTRRAAPSAASSRLAAAAEGAATSKGGNMRKLGLAILMMAAVAQFGISQQKTLTIWLSESETYIVPALLDEYMEAEREHVPQFFGAPTWL